MSRSHPNHWLAHRAAADCETALSERGISICVTVNKLEVLESVSGIGKDYLTPWLDPRLNDFTEENFFWLIASRGDEPVIVGGGRCDYAGHRSDELLLRMFQRGYGAPSVRKVESEVARKMTGRLCYLGDLKSKPKSGLSQLHRRLFVAIANYISASHFRADCTYSFMRSLDVRRGSADTNGFDSRIYKPVQWGDLPDSRCLTEAIVYRNASGNSSYFKSIRQELASHGQGSIADPGDPQPIARAAR